ncbi:serine/threonine-protein kinase [Planctomyces sp. SH-PL62]|uniref:serine/threonine-protein kinase n=1 Tax=Planctomyces sp. SH-PL62 TaxID=1636152 RepID=UPI00078C5F59|nr:serine/threonine-protein kinase [Planctomyces sp. SH-PL62]AMV39429.1 Serine/threonine-protein kinase PrkC [Planctomyces sp. SH-PL62]
MASPDRTRSEGRTPVDLLPVLQSSGVLSERMFEEISSRVDSGEYPADPNGLAERLVRDRLLTAYQARRLLANKAYGMLVGRYVILDRIGAGSMGRVYKAHHQMMDRVVALKIIAPELSCNDRVVARFQREMKLVGRLDHPNVVRAYDADRANRVLYIVMEYVNGESLGDRLKRSGPIPAAEMIDYAAQAALGLAHAHEQGMVHRDVKPSNILLSEDKKVKILDLGLGVLMEADEGATFATADGIAVGTVDYMSPEQALGRDVDGRSDVFSLGCAMYHLMTGKLAFPGESPIDRLGRRINNRHVPITDHLPDFPAAAQRVLDKLMAFKPQDRFQDASEAAEALQSLIRPRSRKPAPALAPAPSPPPVAPRPPEPAEEAAVARPPAPSPATRPPAYPRWFAPLAAAAVSRPNILLTIGLAAFALTFAAGAVVGYLLK